MNVTPSPNPKENNDLQFGLIRHHQVGTPHTNSGPNRSTPFGNSIAVSDVHGVLYLGCNNELVVIKTSTVEECTEESLPCQRIPLPSTPYHVALSSDNNVLIVAVSLNEVAHIYLFCTASLSNGNFKAFSEVSTQTPKGVYVVEISPNPTIPSMFCVTLSDRSMGLFILSGDSKLDFCRLSPSERIVSVSWSPKGKQLVTGKISGYLTQYKPDLKETKNIPPPSPEFEVVSILWLSTYQFLVGYKNRNELQKNPQLYVVNAPKTGPVSYINYDDITFGSGPPSSVKFFFQQIPEWEFIAVCSTGSCEVGLLGGTPEKGEWIQWTLDEFRAEMPCTPNKDEQFPIGMGVGKNSVKLTFKNKVESMPFPVPILFMLSANGTLSSFYIKNIKADCKQITVPPTPFEASSRPGTINIPQAPPREEVKISTPKVQEPSIFSTPAKSSLENTSVTPQGDSHIAKASTPSFSEPITLTSKAPAPTSKEPTLNSKPLISSTPVVAEDPPVEDPELMQEAIFKAIINEMSFFDKVLADFKSSSQSVLQTQVGTDEDKKQLKKFTEVMGKYSKEMAEITDVQFNESFTLQNSTLEGFKWVKEAHSREARSSDPKYLNSLRGRTLDPMSKKKLNSIESKYMYLDQQLKETNARLDDEWNEFKKKQKNKGYSSKVGPEVYNAIINNRKIIEAQRHSVALLADKVSHFSANQFSNARILRTPSKADIELSEMVNLLSTKKSRNKDSLVNKTNVVDSPVRTLDPDKEAHFKKLIESMGTVTIKSTKPANLLESEFLKKALSDEKKNKKSSKVLFQNLEDSSNKENEEISISKNYSDISSKSSSTSTPEKSNISKVNQNISTISNQTPKTQISFAKNLFGSVPGTSTNQSSSSTAPKAAPMTFGLFSSPAKLTPSSQASIDPIVSKSNSNIFGSINASQSIFAFNPESNKDQSLVSSSIGSSITTTSMTFSTNSKSLTTSSIFNTNVSSSSTLFGSSSGTSTKAIASSATDKVSLNIPSISSNSSSFGFADSSTPTKLPSFDESASTKSTSAPSSVSVKFTTTSAASSSFSVPIVSSSTSLTITPVSKPLESSEANNELKSSTVSKPSSIFATSSSATSSNIFGSSTPDKVVSILVSSAPSTVTITPSVEAASIAASSVPSSSLSTSDSTTKELPVSASSSIFGAADSKASSIFESSSASQSSVFGESTPASSVSSVFGASTPVVTSVSAISSSASPVTTKPNLFGSSSPASTSSTSVFGNSTSKPNTPVSNVFGSPVVTSVNNTSVFGNSTSKPTTSVSSVFGSPAKSSISSTSVFGNTAPIATSASVFGSATTASTSGGVFGGSTPTTGVTSMFGGSSAATPFGSSDQAKSSSKIFSTSSPSSTTSNIFANSSASTTSGVVSQSSSPFGNQASSQSGGSSFGNSTSVTSSAGVFGGSPSGNNIFSNQNTVSTTSNAFGSSTNSVFGSSSPSTTSVFGGSSGFGTKSAETPSVFGGSSASGVFGTPDNSNTFGSNNVFSNSQSSNSSGFGAPSSSSNPFGGSSSQNGGSGFFSGLGGQASSANVNKNVFGSTNNFGTNNQAPQNLFGGASSTPFGAPSSSFGNSSPMNNSNTGFGLSTPTKPAASGFGAAPTFGGAPGFGSPPTFGGSPFGNAPPSVASGSIFGSSQPSTGTFGGNMDSSSSGAVDFGSLASQSSVNFGNSSSSFGNNNNNQGSSFSTWR